MTDQPNYLLLVIAFDMRDEGRNQNVITKAVLDACDVVKPLSHSGLGSSQTISIREVLFANSNSMCDWSDAFMDAAYESNRQREPVYQLQHWYIGPGSRTHVVR